MALREKLQESIQRGKVAEMSVFSGFRNRNREMIREEIMRFKDEIVQELQNILEKKIGEDGLTQIKGERGYTPQRGVDYLTLEETQSIMQELRPIKGRDYNDGLHGRDGRNPSQRELETAIARQLAKRPKEKIDIHKIAAEIARSLEKLQGDQKLDYEALKNKPGVPAYGRKKLGGRGGSGFAELTASGSVNGTNAAFIFTTEPRFIISDGVWYKKDAGWTWSYPTATLTIPPIYSIFAIA